MRRVWAWTCFFAATAAAPCVFDPSSLDTGCGLMQLAGTCVLPCHSSEGTCTPVLRDTITTWATTFCGAAGGRTACLFPCKVDDNDAGGGGGSLLGGGGGGASSSSSPPPPPGVAEAVGGSSPPPPGVAEAVGGGGASFACRLQQGIPPVFTPYYADLCPSLGVDECSPPPGGTTYCCCRASAQCGDAC